MVPPGLPGIPQEIIDEVIDFCSGDKKTLLACSLISRAWIYRTRKHLFSTLTLTDKTLPTWCSVVAAPTSNTISGEQSLPHPTCPPSPLTPHPGFPLVTSLELALTHPQTPLKTFGAALLRAETHFSAFINLNSLTLSMIPLTAFHRAPMRACFGSIAETVRELKLSMCSLDGKFPAFLMLFTHLEALELSGNTWIPRALPQRTNILQKDPPTLHGSFTISNFNCSTIRLLDSLSNMRAEYHTITIGNTPMSTSREINTLLAKCKDHLKALVLTAADLFLTRSGFDLLPCRKLVEIHGQFKFSNLFKFASFIATLRTVSSRRFRKLTLIIAPPTPAPYIESEGLAKLDQEISALAKRVGATAGKDTLEVVACFYLTDPSRINLSEIEGALPLISQDPCVSLRTEYLPPPPIR